MARRLLLALAVVALAVPACGGGGGGGGGGGIAVKLAEWSVTVDPASAPAGTVTFNVENGGANVHELVVFKTELAEDALPVVGDAVDETAPDLTLVDEVEDIAPGGTATLTVDLEPGNYVLICNISGHYSRGMHAAFAVS